ncbi:1,2-phenylacetyl-CoA epoxidase subunit PaaB [Paenibacillus apiarius]|uniref:1,2-phenylacetyl-CoA epoxidase subunit B n=1 Tax=Paenibacillus apiarius TaxID=46240 RepID=A0ABT4DX78_9BACL|nr:1,2-phenylacetyl-CoA epoxidase subunit PaaB [Paenibacillus apiarius]MBN3524814.1 1,2-phenylacetyl-CoA epoxidase subunit B [Paenibacillus apiarius]MCY9515705.1 1,2-phenylacetyl-CoA epoxidase subunit B [Paenibacillus apiarius]MCY9521962.1 1,2-phenylacetyl-CoA epoxidase subunit B [Paenibacillus apiarius]MCY9550508.1 1,2-phenylacetyl-CoA epoxidase subunit B [Paenibacillus apiarius]MCY9559843.1 1,2-phenylacetyl-CoA epoxidase subunit B [Paenibacillus apiarius]
MNSAHEEQFAVYEVFSQKNPASGFAHQFSLLAPNHEAALMMARENFMRREPCINIWVVNREDIHGLTPEERSSLERLDNKSYRETKGYGDVQARWRRHKEAYESKAAFTQKGG